MADVNRGNRPLSPHLSIYNQSYTGTLSILHRVTGVAMTLGILLIVWWLLAASSSESYFAIADGFLTSWFGVLIMVGSLFAMWYHFCNGIRHLIWDTGAGMELETVQKSGWIVVGAAGVLTLITLFVAF